MELWELTDKETGEVYLRGGDIVEAQRAKKQAYLDSGGLILNPDALADLYEACKQALRTFEVWRISPTDSRYIMIKQAIAKAGAK